MCKKTGRLRFLESKGGYSRVKKKILYVTRDESRFFSWVVTALMKKLSVNPPAEEIPATFATCYIMYYFPADILSLEIVLNIQSVKELVT